MFWHGPALSRVEQLAMTSFVRNNHVVKLHVYEAPQGVPAGVCLSDAGAIIPARKIFRHRRTGSIAAFADWFRYRVLLECGGIWSDTDVVCLRPLEYAEPEIYAWEDEVRINNAILGLPANHRLAAWMADCCEHPNRILPYDDAKMRNRKWRRRLFEGNRMGNVKWGEYGPSGFTNAARLLGYTDQALPPEHFYPVHYKNWKTIFDGGFQGALPAASRTLHLWNEMTQRQAGFDKNAIFPADSLFEKLWDRYMAPANADGGPARSRA
jgi:hypothetical protein